MAELDLRAGAIAARALAPLSRGGRGQVVTVTGVASAGYDPATRTAETLPNPVQSASGVALDHSVGDIDGTLIRAGDRKFLLSPLNLSGGALSPPAVDDKLDLAGKEWTIKAVASFAPSGAPLYYTLNLRR